MKSTAELTIEFLSAAQAHAARKALDESGFKGDRVRSRVEQKDRRVLIRIEAEDMVALRAMVNSYLRHAQLIEGITSQQ